MSMEHFKKLETEILTLFQEKGPEASTEIVQWMKPTAAPKKRAVIRAILSRLCVKNDGTYFLK